MKKLLSLLAAALVLAGCSSSTTNVNAPVSTMQTAGGSNSTFTVGMECNYAPFNWTQAEANDTGVAINEVDYCDGYDVVIASKIAEGLNAKLIVKAISWEGLIPALDNGEIDAIIAGMTETPERAEAATFTQPYYESQMVVIVRASDTDLVNATSIQDFSGKTVLGQANTLYDEIIDQIDGVNHATPLDTYPRMVLSLQNNEVDGLTAELPVAKGVVAANPDLAIVTFDEGNGFKADTSVSVAVSKDNTELQSSIQSILDGISEEERQTIMEEATNRQPSAE